jgi:hypothetical protein
MGERRVTFLEFGPMDLGGEAATLAVFVEVVGISFEALADCFGPLHRLMCPLRSSSNL